MSRRSADKAITAGRVLINGIPAELGSKADESDEILLDGKKLEPIREFTTIMLNKPEGYVSSRKGQGSKTIYELLPERFHDLKPVGRLDKDSSGLLLLTNDGGLANELTHPRYQKEKVYRVRLNKTLDQTDKDRLLTGVKLSDGLSKFIQLKDCSNDTYEIILAEGRNRQIRRAFNSLGYKVLGLNRIRFGDYKLGVIPYGKFKEVIIRS